MTQRTMRLRSVSPIQLGLVLGVIYFVISIFIAAFLFIASRANVGAFDSMGVFGSFAIFFLPIGYFVCGFLGGIITAALYNLVAGWIGGVELTLEQPLE
jgi:hypothetical protein